MLAFVVSPTIGRISVVRSLATSNSFSRMQNRADRFLAPRHFGLNRGCCMSAFDPQTFFNTLTLGGIVFALLETKPQGHLNNPALLEVKKSTLSGAGLGVFLLESCEKGTVLGCYPGRIWADHSWLRYKGSSDVQNRARQYIWRLNNGDIIDPTNSEGLIEEKVPWILPFGFRMPVSSIATVLARINEPGLLGDTNVCTEERDGLLYMVLERQVAGGEELFLDYGPHYDRRGYMLQGDMEV